MNDEVPDEGDYDAGRGRGEFDNITPEDFIHGGGSGHGNPPGWLGPSDINRARHQMPIAYVEIVPVRTCRSCRSACSRSPWPNSSPRRD